MKFSGHSEAKTIKENIMMKIDLFEAMDAACNLQQLIVLK